MSGQIPKTVYLLGAGASYASVFNLPIMDGFFGPTVDSLPLKIPEFLQWYYPNAEPAKYNLEEILSYLHLSSTRLLAWNPIPRSSWGAGQVEYNTILTFVRERLTIPKGKTCPLHIQLFKTLRETDTVMTLNYDLVSDTALLEVETPQGKSSPGQDTRMGKLKNLIGDAVFWGGRPPGLLPQEQSKGFFLKLHGSLDWIRCPTANCPNHGSFFSLTIERLSEGQSAGLPCRLCAAALQTFLVPPVGIKRLDDTGRLAFLWSLALKELMCASSHVYIGISLAPSDFELRWLIKQALELRPRSVSPPEVTIINPSREHSNRVKQLYPSEGNVVECDSLEAFFRNVEGGRQPQ